MTTILTPRRSLSLLPVLSVLVPLPASAAEAPESESNTHEPSFGEAHQLAISGATQLTARRNWTVGAGEGSQSYQDTSFAVLAGADYFVVRGLSIGLTAGYSHFSQDGYPTGDSLGLGARVGYAIPLAKQWSLWPDVSASYATAWFDGQTPPQSVSLGAYVPFLFHPASHFFFGIGPELTSTSFHDQPGVATSTTLALAANLGGWVGL